MKSCRASAFRKFIVRLPGQPENERCSSPAYVDCQVAKQHCEDQPSVDHCPFLHESLVQYCAAAAVPQYIPYSESESSQCSSESFAYCRLYAEMEHPASAADAAGRSAAEERGVGSAVDGIPVPGWLWYSPNHMWLDVNAEGTYHIGIDAFLAGVLGSVDSLTFLTLSGLQRPAVVLSVGGVDLHMAFPGDITIKKANTYLRTDPSRMLSDPYSFGWLFEGRKARPASRELVPAGLIPGSEAGAWMEGEVRHATRFAREIAERPDARGSVCMADGGALAPGFLRHLDREGALRFYNEFLSPRSIPTTVTR